MPTIAHERQIHTSLQIGRPDGATWEELYDYLSSVEVELGDISGVGTGQSGVDGVVRRMVFRLRNNRLLNVLIWPADGVVSGDRVLDGAETVDGASTGGEWLARLLDQEPQRQGDSFSPRDRISAWNRWNGQYAPLLWPNREVVVQVATTPIGQFPLPTQWRTIFHGLLGDVIRTEGPTVECELRDLAKRLQDAYITPEMIRPYDSSVAIPAETLMQNLLDDVLGRGVVTLYFPGGTETDPRPISESPGWMVYPKAEIWEFKSLWDALQYVVSQFGWFLGYRWHEDTRRMQLILMEPPREKDAASADFHLSWKDDIYSAPLEITDRDVRNIIVGTFWNRDTERRETMMVRDEDSIAEFGPRAAQIDEGETSLIDTPEEMERLLLAALHDLKDLTGTTHIEMPLLPEMDVFAGIVLDDPRVSSEPLFYGVESVRHTLDFEAGRFRTEIVGAGRVIGSRVRWLQMQTRPGVRQPPKTITLFPPEQVTATAEEQGGDTVIRVEWTPRPNAITYLVQWWPEGSEEFRSARVSEPEYVITDLPQGAIPWPSSTLYPSVDMYPMPAIYQVGVAMISDFGRISELNVVSVDMGI